VFGIAWDGQFPPNFQELLGPYYQQAQQAAAEQKAAAQRFLAMLVRSFAADLAAAWVPVAPVELELVKQETNPRLVQLGAANEAVLIAKFTVEFASRSGTIDWLLPEALLAPVREALAAVGGQKPLLSQEAWAPVLTTALQNAELDTRANSAHETLKSEKAQLQAELERTRDERNRLASDLAGMKRETEESWASERVENALLRERINDVAAEVARLASALEGPNSPIDAILAAETVRDRTVTVTSHGETKRVEGSSSNGDLADRIRALQTHASRVTHSDKPQ